jgi:hypothetical protein
LSCIAFWLLKIPKEGSKNSDDEIGQVDYPTIMEMYSAIIYTYCEKSGTRNKISQGKRDPLSLLVPSQENNKKSRL